MTAPYKHRGLVPGVFIEGTGFLSDREARIANAAYLRGIQQGREEGVAWQPIHTAPTSDLHRVEVLLCHHGRQGWTQIGWWSKHLQQWVADYDGDDRVIADMTDPPTHWMRIPYRPTNTQPTTKG